MHNLPVPNIATIRNNTATIDEKIARANTCQIYKTKCHIERIFYNLKAIRR